MRMTNRLIAISLAIIAAPPAHAQPVATPYLHANFGDVEVRRGGLGAYLGYFGRHLGIEIDIDRHNHFFKDKELDSIPNPCVPGRAGTCIDDDTDAWIAMGNMVAFIPVSDATRWRLYGTTGAGLIYAWVHDAGMYNSDQTNVALNIGAGATYRLNSWLGLRGDLRYFHAFVDEDRHEGGYYRDYDFVRVSLGVTFTVPGSAEAAGSAPVVRARRPGARSAASR